MPWNSQSGGPWGAGGKNAMPPDLEEFLRRGQDKLRTVLPSGGLRGKRIGLVAIAVVAIWGFSGFFQVDPEELGVVLRFGQYVRDAKPGLRYHLPYPIEAALTPKVTRVNRIDIGLRGVDDPRRGSASREVPEESLMLTGDENIIDVEFSVFWLIKPDAVGDYLFNIQQPGGTVKAVAESAMREVIGRSEITGAAASAAQALDAPQGPGAAAPGSILTAGRATAETTVQEIMQKTLDSYHAGVQITQVQLQKVDPPAQVIDSFRDVQAALSDAERAQNEAQTYANQVIPNARGRAAQITQAANAYREQTVVEAIGQTARFLKIYEEYKKAPNVTRKRMYLETMERLFKGTDKIILDSRAGSGVVPYPPLTELTRPENLRPAAPPNPAQTPQTPGSR